MFPDVLTDDKRSLEGLKRAIRSPRDLVPNLRRAEAIIEFRKKSVSNSIGETFPSHSITIDNKVRLTHSFALEIDGRRVIPFVDLRKSGSLSSHAREFLFAMNFHLIVDTFSDFSDFGLVVLDYWEDSALSKGFTPHFFSGTPRYSYAELSDMIARTHSIWLEVLEGRKRGGEESGPIGPLFA
ncbi:MAG: hypothetical protein II336_04475 [Loktanella sp.]|nr:hypothetical protein [Loktanella sp.]